MNSSRTITDESENRYLFNSQFQEALQRQFKTQLAQWKSEMFEELKTSMSECNFKFNRNRETMNMMKQHLTVNSQSINEIESKLSEYDEKIIEFETFVTTGGHTFQSNDLEQSQTLKSMVIIEQSDPEQQMTATTLSKYIRITDELLQNFENYKASQAEELASRVRLLEDNLTEVLESKIGEMTFKLEDKIESIEKHVRDSKTSDEIAIERMKNKIDHQIRCLDAGLKEEISTLHGRVSSLAEDLNGRFSFFLADLLIY